MKCGPSICGMDGIQIRQRRVSCVPLGTQKNVYGFLHTRSSLAPKWSPSSTLLVGPHWAALGRLTASRIRRPGFGVPDSASRIRRPARAYARVNQLCLFSASRPFTTTPASASFFSRLPVIIGVATSRPISAAWL